MYKQLSAGIVSLGMVSTMTAPVMAQTTSATGIEANSVPSNNILVEDYFRSGVLFEFLVRYV